MINNLKWQALRTQSDYCILAQHSRATETIRAVWHGEGDRYDFAVMILGGRHDGIIIQCSTEASVMWLFDMVRVARKTGREWNWLAPLDALDGWDP